MFDNLMSQMQEQANEMKKKLDTMTVEAEAETEAETEAEDEVETYECPECSHPITADMDACPNCGVGLSFEVEEVEEQE